MDTWMKRLVSATSYATANFSKMAKTMTVQYNVNILYIQWFLIRVSSSLHLPT